MFIDTIIQREASLIVSGFKVISCAQKAIQPDAKEMDTSSFHDYAAGEMETHANPLAWLISAVFACILAVACVAVCTMALIAKILVKSVMKHPIPDAASESDITQAVVVIVAIVSTVMAAWPK